MAVDFVVDPSTAKEPKATRKQKQLIASIQRENPSLEAPRDDSRAAASEWLSKYVDRATDGWTPESDYLDALESDQREPIQPGEYIAERYFEYFPCI